MDTKIGMAVEWIAATCIWSYVISLVLTQSCVYPILYNLDGEFYYSSVSYFNTNTNISAILTISGLLGILVVSMFRRNRPYGNS